MSGYLLSGGWEVKAPEAALVYLPIENHRFAARFCHAETVCCCSSYNSIVIRVIMALVHSTIIIYLENAFFFLFFFV